MIILTRIERHLHRTRMSPSSFGRAAIGDPRLVADLRRGRRIGPAIAGKIEAYLDAQETMLEDERCRRR